MRNEDEEEDECMEGGTQSGPSPAQRLKWNEEMIEALKRGPDDITLLLCQRVYLEQCCDSIIPVRTKKSLEGILELLKTGQVSVAALLALVKAQHFFCKSNFYVKVWEDILSVDVISASTITPQDLLTMQRMMIVKPQLTALSAKGNKPTKNTAKSITSPEVRQALIVGFYEGVKIVVIRVMGETGRLAQDSVCHFSRFMVEAISFFKWLGCPGWLHEKMLFLREVLNRQLCSLPEVPKASTGVAAVPPLLLPPRASGGGASANTKPLPPTSLKPKPKPKPESSKAKSKSKSATASVVTTAVPTPMISSPIQTVHEGLLELQDFLCDQGETDQYTCDMYAQDAYMAGYTASLGHAFGGYDGCGESNMVVTADADPDPDPDIVGGGAGDIVGAGNVVGGGGAGDIVGGAGAGAGDVIGDGGMLADGDELTEGNGFPLSFMEDLEGFQFVPITPNGTRAPESGWLLPQHALPMPQHALPMPQHALPMPMPQHAVVEDHVVAEDLEKVVLQQVINSMIPPGTDLTSFILMWDSICCP